MIRRDSRRSVGVTPRAGPPARTAGPDRHFAAGRPAGYPASRSIAPCTLLVASAERPSRVVTQP